MTPRYEWTSASEPPDTERRVLVWMRYPDGDQSWSTDYYYKIAKWESDYVTHWRDVEPPEAK